MLLILIRPILAPPSTFSRCPRRFIRDYVGRVQVCAVAANYLTTSGCLELGACPTCVIEVPMLLGSLLFPQVHELLADWVWKWLILILFLPGSRILALRKLRVGYVKLLFRNLSDLTLVWWSQRCPVFVGEALDTFPASFLLFHPSFVFLKNCFKLTE